MILQFFFLSFLPCLFVALFATKRLVRWMEQGDRHSIVWLFGLLGAVSFIAIAWLTCLGFLLLDIRNPWADAFFPFLLGGMLLVILPITVIYFCYRIAVQPTDPK